MPDLNIHMGLPPVTTPQDRVTLDLEIFGMDENRLHRPDNGTFASLQICTNGKDVYIITNEHDVDQAINNVRLSTHIYHNASFDMTHLRRWTSYEPRENYADTYVLERLLWSGHYMDFGLADLSRRYLNEYMDKDIRKEFIKSQELTEEMIRYGALDALLTWHNYAEQDKILTKNMRNVWKEIEAPCIFAIMDFKGFKFDAKQWLINAEHNLLRAQELQSELGFNPGSWQQTLQALHQSGLRKLTSTGADELLPYREYPLVAKILECRMYAKRASTYGTEMVAKYYEKDGKIHSAFNTVGAETGRFSSSSPNNQNVPAIKEFRSCFTAEDDDHSLIILDQKQQEPRITAWHSQDEHLVSICQSGKNIHLEVGRAIYSDPNLKKTDVRYKHAKAINLALVYGMTPAGLRRKINEDAETEEEKITQADADRLLANHFANFPKVKRWIDAQHRLGEKQGYVDTAFGRRTHLNLYSYQWMNNALNNPIQGGGADTIKLAINRIHRECRERKIEYPLVSTIHDEIVADVKKEDVPEYSEMLKNAMVQEAERVYTGIPFGVDLVVGKNWWCAKELE